MHVILAPTYDLAKQYAQEHRVDATVEAEYGERVVEGEALTLAHHGPRANNPAPCNDPKAVKLPDDSTVMISHLDLDTLGGILALQGKKPEDQEFWDAAEYVDVNGPHHIYEFSGRIKDKLNAYYGFEFKMRNAEARLDREHVTEVTDSVEKYGLGLYTLLDRRAPEKDRAQMIEEGRKWRNDVTRVVESRLVKENHSVRVFVTDGPFCNGSYYSPQQKAIIPAVVSYNKKFHSITLSFEDGGKNLSAKEIVQSLWGPEAGGRDGIAGSPRGQKMTIEDLENATRTVEKAIREKEKEMNQKSPIEEKGRKDGGALLKADGEKREKSQVKSTSSPTKVNGEIRFNVAEMLRAAKERQAAAKKPQRKNVCRDELER